MLTFQSGGVTLAYIDVAATTRETGVPVLLIHGFGSSHIVNWVNTGWVRALVHAGRRVIAFDNRGHGESQKLYDPADYATPKMARDALNLLDHLGVPEADVMGYSMGARIAAFLALAHADRVRRLILGGLGHHLVDGVGLPLEIAEAMEAPALESLTDPMQRMFRRFADQNRGDLRALAACIRGSRQTLSENQTMGIRARTLIAIGTKDNVAGDPHRLAAMFPNARAFEIDGRDHNLAVGDKSYKAAVLDFIGEAE